MHGCMGVCVDVCIARLYMHVCICMYVYMFGLCVYIHVLYISLYTHKHTHTSTHAHTQPRMDTYVCIVVQGEVMSIARDFTEGIQKALRMVNGAYKVCVCVCVRACVCVCV